MNFNAFITDIQQNQWNVFGVEVYETGRLTHEYNDTLASSFPIYSAAKEILSIGAGIAQDQGKFNIEKSVLSYLPAKALGQINRSPLLPHKRRIVKHT